MVKGIRHTHNFLDEQGGLSPVPPRMKPSEYSPLVSEGSLLEAHMRAIAKLMLNGRKGKTWEDQVITLEQSNDLPGSDTET